MTDRLDRLAADILRDDRTRPSPRAAREHTNILAVLRRIDTGHTYPLNVPGILTLHRDLMTGAELEQPTAEPVTPGTLRTRDLPGAPATGLRQHLTTTLAALHNNPPLTAACGAHWAIATLIPFADGNGRTARLLGIATLTAHTGNIHTAATTLRPHWQMTRNPTRRAAALLLTR